MAAVKQQTQLFTKLPKIDAHSISGSFVQNTSQSYSGLSGPSYSISGIPEKFKLPPATVLKPGIEQAPGKLDSWPVHPLKPAPSNLSLGQSPSKGSSIQHIHVQQSPVYSSPKRIPLEKQAIVPKPKFLEQLESYLHKELRLLGCPPSGPHELRLQAHREVFEYLIEDFKTYKPLLAAIKNEYELFLRYQQDVIQELEPMRGELETTREECERKIMILREEGKQEEAGVEQENKRLLGVIEQMRNEEKSYQSQIEKLQSEIAELYEQYRNEADARKLLVSDYNDLKFRQQEQKSDEGGAQEEREDPVLLKLKLVRAREDLKVANQRINTMLADYGDVVPRREFEMLETSYKAMETDNETLKNDHTALMQEHKTLQSLYTDVLSQRDRLTDDLGQLKRSATPRPDWDRCAQYIEGGAENWSVLTEGRSSNQKVDILLAQIAGVDVSEISKDDVFQGKGLGDGIPRYLRTEGSVKNRQISRKDTNQLINRFWHYRLTSEDGTKQNLDECLYAFLLSHNENNEQLAIEDGYNLKEACSRFVHEPQIALFGKILRDEQDEDVFHYWLNAQTTLTEAFSSQQEEEGLINESTLKDIASSQLPGKPEHHVSALVTSATQTASTTPDMVDFIKLLSPDDDGQPSEFALLLLEQNKEENKLFVNEIAQALGDKSKVTLDEFQSIIQSIDPSKPAEDVQHLISKVFPGQTEAEQQQTVAKCLEILHYTGVFRSGPRPS